MVRAQTEGQGKRRIYREERPVKSLENVSFSLCAFANLSLWGRGGSSGRSQPCSRQDCFRYTFEGGSRGGNFILRMGHGQCCPTVSELEGPQGPEAAQPMPHPLPHGAVVGAVVVAAVSSSVQGQCRSGLTLPRRGKVLFDRQEHVQERIRGITSYPELQQISTALQSQRFRYDFLFFTLFSSPLSSVSRSSSTCLH